MAGVVSLWLLLANTSLAQTYIFGRASIAVGPDPFSVASADFNGDGVLDLVSADQSDNTVSVVLGNSDGSFTPPVSYPTGPAPTAVVAGDFNGDGNLDLAVTNGNCTYNSRVGIQCGSGTISILLGNGDGSFQPHFDYAVGTYPSAVAAGDFNGDGELDLAITNNQDGTVSVLLGNGDGTFKAQVVYPVAPNTQSVVVADFNDDHKLDLAAGGNGVSILLGNGDGTFQSALQTPGGWPLAAADFNLDGKLDLYAGGTVLLGKGDGTFVLNASYAGGGVFAAAADLNGDGKPDLAVAQFGTSNLSPQSMSVLLGNGDGTFQSAVEYGAPYPAGIIATDLNGDGKVDLIGAGTAGCMPFDCMTSSPGSILVLLGFGDGTFVGGMNYPSSVVGQLLSADFNGDGKADIASEESFIPGGPTPIGIFLGNGDGTFQPGITTLVTGSNGGIASGDFNGDGKADIATVFANCSNNTCLPGEALVLIGNGDGTFQAPVQYSVGLQPEYLAVGDFNGDNKPDLAVSNFKSNTISILLNNGNGTFQSHVDSATGPSPAAIGTGDFNGDGKLDLVTASYSGATVSVLLGNGDGTFQTHVDYPIPVGVYWLTVGDFNGDGKPDLAVTSETTEQVFILLGNGDGTFQTAVASPDGTDFGLPSIGDFNGDGKIDLAMGGSYAYTASILLGNGDGTFQQPITNFLAQGPIAVADYNQDGSPDLASGTGYGFPSFNVSVMLSGAFKTISPASLNFGSQGADTTSPPQTITIGNQSSVSFNIARIEVNGSFSQTSDCGASLAIGAHCTVTVTFSPTSTGPQSGAVTITDSTRISPLAIPLSGIGVNGPFLTASPIRVNFAPQAIGVSSMPATVMLVNTGNAALGISNIGIVGANSGNFALNNACASSLGASNSCSLSITFTPSAGGSRIAKIAISDTAPGSPQMLNLSGTGLGPVASLSLNTLTFAFQAIGTASAPQIVTLTNIGSDPLDITGIVASTNFTQTNTCNASVAAESNCQISVTFTPTVAGNLSGAVMITDNATGSPQIVALSGTGTGMGTLGFGIPSGGSSSETVSAGGTAKYALFIGGAGTGGQTSIMCTGAPTGAACTVTPSSLNVSATSPSSIAVSVTTLASMNAALAHPRGNVWMLGAGVVGFVLLPMCNKKRFAKYLGILPLMVLLMLSACGGGGSGSVPPSQGGGTPSGTYPLTVTATPTGGTPQSVKLTLIVQ
jgi:hypothetical protein